MRYSTVFCLAAALFLVQLPPCFSGERTIPVDFFFLVDKSLSMAEENRFTDMHEWVNTHLLTQMLIPGDWITIWQFYGTTEQVFTATIVEDADKHRVADAFNRIRPDGEYTDIGLALDTIKDALNRREPNDRMKIMYLLTDLKQEAPWTSRYAGIEERFTSPYLAQARTIDHGSWYEITLDMDIHQQVVQTSRNLYYSIVESSVERDRDFNGSSDLDTENSAATREISQEADSQPQDNSVHSYAAGKDSAAGKEHTSRPIIYALFVLLFLLIIVGTGILVAKRRRSSSRDERRETRE